MKSSGQRFRIGDVAGRFGLATHVLRYWESMGLLSPDRDGAGHRTYGRDDLYRVAAILQAKEAGLALDDIATMLTTSDPSARTAVLHQRHDELATRIAETERALALVDTALQCRHGDLATCPVFQAHLSERVEAAR